MGLSLVLLWAFRALMLIMLKYLIVLIVRSRYQIGIRFALPTYQIKSISNVIFSPLPSRIGIFYKPSTDFKGVDKAVQTGSAG
jgi:hypothetical protein